MFLIDRFRLSQRRACALVNLSRSTFRYHPKEKNDADIRERIKEIARDKRRYGYRRIHVILKREGISINHKRTERIYREENLSLKNRKKKRAKSSVRVVLSQPKTINEIWAMDFMSDSFYNGRRFRIFNVIDVKSRECLASEVDLSISGKRVSRILDRLIYLRGKPNSILCDNGPEFTSNALDQWAYSEGIDLQFITPGRPIENAFIESFNGRIRDECLNDHWFMNLNDARIKIEYWRNEDNFERPHSSLGDLTPVEYAERLNNVVLEVINL